MKTIKVLLLSLLLAFGLKAADITVAAASDLQYAMDEIAAIYKKSYPNDEIRLIMGSSGKFYTQITNGAPFDLYFSADMAYVQKLHEAGFTRLPPKAYAIGRVGLWSSHRSGIDVSQGIESLEDPRIRRIAIANWDHAPYGRAAKEALVHYDLFKEKQPLFVMGENISQTAHFAASGAAEVGIIALSLAKAEALSQNGNFFLLPAESHNTILQGYAPVKRNGQNEAAVMRFYEFIDSPQALKILEKYGFVRP